MLFFLIGAIEWKKKQQRNYVWKCGMVEQKEYGSFNAISVTNLHRRTQKTTVTIMHLIFQDVILLIVILKSQRRRDILLIR